MAENLPPEVVRVFIMGKEYRVPDSLTIQKALKAARYPYDRLLEDLGQRGALFDVVVSHQTFKYDKTLDGVPVSIQWLFNGYEAHALAIHVSDRVDEGTGSVDAAFAQTKFLCRRPALRGDRLAGKMDHAIGPFHRA